MTPIYGEKHVPNNQLECHYPSGERLHSKLERFTMLLMGKSTICIAIFNSKLLNYQRVMVMVNDTTIVQICANINHGLYGTLL